MSQVFPNGNATYSELELNFRQVRWYQPGFMKWWAFQNRLLASRGQPEMLYAEARDWFEDYQHNG